MTTTTAAAKTRAVTLARITRSGEVLDLVRRGGGQTTSELAEAMGVARSTVAERVDLLVEHGLLTLDSGDGAGPRQRGRPASRLAFNSRAGIALAAQLGISGARLGVTDLVGTVLTSTTIDIDLDRGPDATLRTIGAYFDRALAALGESWERVHGLGLGLPSRIELAVQPQLTDEAPGSWDETAVSQTLAQTFAVPVLVDHDVNMMAFAEYSARWSTAETLLCVKAGTVIGCGIVVNGSVLKGATYLAGEVGHTRVGSSDAQCVCGNVGCLNAVSGGGAIARRLRQEGLDTPTARSVADLANRGDIRAGQAIREAGRNIGEVLAGAVNLLNPDIICVWGYLADAENQLFAGIHESIARHAVPGAGHTLRIERATLGDDSGIYGAAMVVAENALRPAAVDAYLIEKAGLPAE